MKKLVMSIIVLTLILALFAGCSVPKPTDESKEPSEQNTESNQGEENKSEDTQTVQSGNSSLSLDFPKSWRETDLNDIATIKMAAIAKEQYMIVIEETSVNFAENFTLDDYTSIILGNTKQMLIDFEEPSVNEVMIGDNLAAKQFELTGTLENKIKVKYLVTCVENDGVFYQITAWSLQSTYDEAKPVFDDILKSATF